MLFTDDMLTEIPRILVVVYICTLNKFHASKTKLYICQNRKIHQIVSSNSDDLLVRDLFCYNCGRWMLSSIWARFKSYFGWIEGWIYRKWRHRNSRDRKWRHRERSWPEVTFPEVARTGSDRVRMRNQIPRFFLTIVVVQNVSLRMTDMATGCDVTPNGGSLGRVGCARAQYPS